MEALIYFLKVEVSRSMIAILEAYPEIEFENIRQALNYKAYAV